MRSGTLLKESLSLLPIEKKRILRAVPEMTQERIDAITSILESEKTKIDAMSDRGERIGRLIGSLRIIAALDWAEVESRLFAENP